MVANMRKRFCPMASKKPRFCVRRSLIALYMNWRKSVCMGSAPSDAGWVKQLRHAEVLKRTGQRAGDLGHVPRKAGTTADVGIDGVSGHFTLLFGRDGLLFEKRSEQLVGILNGAQRQDVGCVDLVQDLDFAVYSGAAGQRVLLEVVDLGLEGLGVSSNRTDSQKRVGVHPVGEFDGGVLGFHAGKFIGVHAGKRVGIVSAKLGRGLAVTQENGLWLAGVR